MKKAEFLATVRKEIHYIFARNDIEKELEQHINESIEDLLAEGLSLDEAEEQAVLQMGEVKEIGRELNKEHNPILGYLISLTRLILILMVYPLLISLLVGAGSIRLMIFPVQREGYLEKYEVDVSIDTPIHYVKVDDLYFYEDGQCSVTLRTYQKFWECRVCDVFNLKFVDQTGNEILTARSSSISAMIARHDVKFSKDEMTSIYLQTADGQTLEIPLEEDAYETK